MSSFQLPFSLSTADKESPSSLKVGTHGQKDFVYTGFNTPPGAKLGLCRRTIYSKLSTSDHNLFQIILRESKFFFEHQIFLSLSHCRGIKRKVGAGEIGIEKFGPHIVIWRW